MSDLWISINLICQSTHHTLSNANARRVFNAGQFKLNGARISAKDASALDFAADYTMIVSDLSVICLVRKVRGIGLCVCVLVVRRWFIGGRLDTQHKCFDSAGDAALEGDLRAMFYVEFSGELHGDSDAFFMLLSCASLSFLMIWDFCGSQISKLVPFFMGQVVKWRWSIWFVDVETSTIIKINFSKIYGSQCYTYIMIHFVSIMCIFFRVLD